MINTSLNRSTKLGLFVASAFILIVLLSMRTGNVFALAYGPGVSSSDSSSATAPGDSSQTSSTAPHASVSKKSSKPATNNQTNQVPVSQGSLGGHKVYLVLLVLVFGFFLWLFAAPLHKHKKKANSSS